MSERIVNYIKSSGYKNISEFARAVGEDATNTHKIVKGIQKPQLEKLFKYADALNCTIDQVLMLFYPDLMNEHIKHYNSNH